MIYNILPKSLKPTYKKLYFKTFYNILTLYNFKNKFGDLRFINYGYATEEDKNISISIDFIYKLQTNLYLFLMNHAKLDGKDVIEIGCGRGGGCSLLRSNYKPKRVVGVDISELNIKKCINNFNHQNIEFIKGDAEKQQFANKSFDVVINLESSHCYASKKNFFNNVSSILKPNGYFLYADIFHTGNVIFETERLLKESGLEIEKIEDISENVLLSLELFSKKRDDILKSSPILRLFNIHEKFAASDSINFIKFKSGQKKYLFYLLRKN